MSLADVVLKVGIVAILTLGAIFDVRFRRIPNALTFGGAILGCAANLAFRQIPGGISSVEGWVLGAVLLWIPFVLGGMGAGDAKLLAAAGAWGGPEFAFTAAILAAFVGAIAALGILLVNRRLTDTLRPFLSLGRLGLALLFSSITPRALRWAPVRESTGAPSPATTEKIRFPYGPALAIGGLAALVLR